MYGQSSDSWKVYNDSTLARIDITIDSTKLQWMYANTHSDSEHIASIHFKNLYIDETVDSIGFRLRGNTSRDAQKKSFKVSFNSFMKGRKFHGVKKLNLNGEHNDPSITRSKLCWDLYNDIGMPGSRASHAKVYINGKYYGLYISVEQVDEEFLNKNYIDDTGNLWKCLYPADLKYLGADPNLYKNLMNGTTPAYELSTNEEIGDFSALAHLIDIINNSPAASLPDSVEQYIQFNRVLEYFAINTLVGSWDDYRSLMNNYFLYHNPTENTFTILPYDYDNTFGVDWSGNNWSTADPYNFPKVVGGVRPLAEKMLANDQYRDLFTHFVRFYRDNVYQLSLWENRIDRLKNLISTAAQEDTYRTLDYGFTMNDFNNSYSASFYMNKHVKFGIKQFINARNASVVSQLSYKNSPPIAYSIQHTPQIPAANDSIVVSASCFGIAGLKEVKIEFNKIPLSSIQSYTMNKPISGNSKRVEDVDRWIGTIPPIAPGVLGRYRISLKDSLDRIQVYPRHGFIDIAPTAHSASSVVINEFLADNTTIPDSSGQFDDWVELYNPTDAPVVLTNKYMTDKAGSFTKWKFTQPNLTIAPKAFLLLWCDDDSTQKGIHTNFKLSAGGEYLALTDSDEVSVLDSITFGPQKKNISFGRYPDGTSSWGSMSPTPWAKNSVITSVEGNRIIPISFSISVFPNPFNPATTIQYSVPHASDVTLKIFDLLGREIRTLIHEQKEPGRYSVEWNGKSNDGSSAGSGIYFLLMNNEGSAIALKLLLLK